METSVTKKPEVKVTLGKSSNVQFLFETEERAAAFVEAAKKNKIDPVPVEKSDINRYIDPITLEPFFSVRYAPQAFDALCDIAKQHEPDSPCYGLQQNPVGYTLNQSKSGNSKTIGSISVRKISANNGNVPTEIHAIGFFNAEDAYAFVEYIEKKRSLKCLNLSQVADTEIKVTARQPNGQYNVFMPPPEFNKFIDYINTTRPKQEFLVDTIKSKELTNYNEFFAKETVYTNKISKFQADHHLLLKNPSKDSNREVEHIKKLIADYDLNHRYTYVWSSAEERLAGIVKSGKDECVSITYRTSFMSQDKRKLFEDASQLGEGIEQDVKNAVEAAKEEQRGKQNKAFGEDGLTTSLITSMNFYNKNNVNNDPIPYPTPTRAVTVSIPPTPPQHAKDAENLGNSAQYSGPSPQYN